MRNWTEMVIMYVQHTQVELWHVENMVRTNVGTVYGVRRSSVTHLLVPLRTFVPWPLSPLSHNKMIEHLCADGLRYNTPQGIPATVTWHSHGTHVAVRVDTTYGPEVQEIYPHAMGHRGKLHGSRHSRVERESQARMVMESSCKRSHFT